MRVVIILASEPRGKGRHRSTVRQNKSTGRLEVQNYPDPKTATYEARLTHAMQVAMQQQNPGALPSSQPFRVAIKVYTQAPQGQPGPAGQRLRAAMLQGKLWPTKKPDCDNYGKTVGDAGNGVLWRDDAVIVEMIIRKFWSDEPRIEIVAETMDPGPLEERPAPPKPKPKPAARAAADLFEREAAR